jgi:hypothetical protein
VQHLHRAVAVEVADAGPGEGIPHASAGGERVPFVIGQEGGLGVLQGAPERLRLRVGVGLDGADPVGILEVDVRDCPPPSSVAVEGDVAVEDLEVPVHIQIDQDRLVEARTREHDVEPPDEFACGPVEHHVADHDLRLAVHVHVRDGHHECQSQRPIVPRLPTRCGVDRHEVYPAPVVVHLEHDLGPIADADGPVLVVVHEVADERRGDAPGQSRIAGGAGEDPLPADVPGICHGGLAAGPLRGH